jgi:hypothetical protein
MIQAIAPYHRNELAHQFFQDINLRYFEKPDSWSTIAVADALSNDDTVAPKTTRVSLRKLYKKLLVRNYLRFGVPNNLLRTNPRWGTENVSLKRALNLDLDVDEISYTDQTLRDLGAWFCPNHFKDPHKNFSNLGDFLAYNMLIDLDFLSDVTRHKQAYDADLPDVQSLHMGTFLHDVVSSPGSFPEFLKQIEDLIKKYRLDTSFVGTKKTRAEILATFGRDLQKIIQREFINTHIYEQQFEEHSSIYWMFPRTKKCSDEIFSGQARAKKNGCKIFGRWTVFRLS